jgi:hypothetical protein
MKAVMQKVLVIASVVFGLLHIAPVEGSELRTAEFRFQLSSDPGSEFSAKLPVVTPGSLKIEAEWSPLNTGSKSSAPHTKLSLLLLRPDNTEVARTSGTTPLRLEMRVSEQDLGRSNDRDLATWTFKIVNGGGDNRTDVAGVLRAAIPIVTGIIVDKDFVLLGSGNAREIAFFVSGPGRLAIDASWENDSTAASGYSASQLTVVLLHPGDGRTYARKQGRSPLTIEQQIVGSALDGVRWVVKVQNDTPTRVKGRLKVRFSPAR